MKNTSEIRENPLGLSAGEPWVVIPIDAGKGQVTITEEDSCWSGGNSVSSTDINKCKTILFYRTSESSQLYTNGKSTSTGVSVNRYCYLYDVENGRLFDYEYLDKDLPSSTKGTPHLEVSMQEMTNWLKSKIKH